MITAAEIARMSRSELTSLLHAGAPTTPRDVVGASYRGTSLGLPRLVEKLTWRTFRKVFVDDPERGPRGFNVRMHQSTGEPLRCRSGKARVFGHFAIVPAASYATPWGPSSGVMLDYGLAAHALDPLGRSRDVVVAVEEGRFELLLGALYVDVLGYPVATPSFFTLEREGPPREAAEPAHWNADGARDRATA